MNTKLAGATALVLACTGCATEKYFAENRDTDQTAAFQLTDRRVVEEIDLGWLLYRAIPPTTFTDTCEKHAQRNTLKIGGETMDSNSADSPDPQKEKARLDKAESFFNCVIGNLSASEQRQIRNAVQERILIASEQRCNAFKANLQRDFSRKNFWLGSGTTVAGTAGALVNGLTAARYWAGISAALSGVRAEYNQDYWGNLAAHVITEGIDQHRKRTYGDIQEKRKSLGYAEYPVEAAIKDALIYHGLCSVPIGLQEAGNAVKYANDPGLMASLNTYAKIHTVYQSRDGDLLATVKKISNENLSAVGSKNADKSEAASENHLDLLLSSLAHINLAEKALKDWFVTTKTKVTDSTITTALGLSEAKNQPQWTAKIPGECKTRMAKLYSDEIYYSELAKKEADVAKRLSNLQAASNAGVASSLISTEVKAYTQAYLAAVNSAREKRIKVWDKNSEKALAKDDAAQKEIKNVIEDTAKEPDLSSTVNNMTSLCKAP